MLSVKLICTGNLKEKYLREAFAEYEKRLSDEKPLKGKKIAVSVHLEAKTAYLALVLKNLGAECAVTGCNPLSTQDPIAAALAEEGLNVYGIHGATPEQYHRHLNMALDIEPDIIIDDGGDFVCLIKPQFEVGRSGLNKKGIVKNDSLRKNAVNEVLDFANCCGFKSLGIMESPILGGDGNTEYLAHFKKCYSPYITSYPLLVIKQEDIFYNVQYYAPFLSLYVKNCIKLIWKFYSCNKSKILGQPGNYEEIKHIIVGSKRSSFTSIPLHHPQNHFRFDLTEFSSPRLQEHLISLFNIWSFDTKLAQIYRRAIRFFCWDMDEGSRPYEYFSIRIQMMFIGIETLLLTFSYSGEKKRKIAKIMIQLYTANKYSSKEIEDAVISLYNSRNTYAHTGVDESFRYRPKLDDDGQLVIDDASLKIVDHVFNNILVTFPMKYNELLKAEDGENEWRKITQDFIKKTSLIQKLLNLFSFLCLCKKK